jgi:hypothetical protein
VKQKFWKDKLIINQFFNMKYLLNIFVIMVILNCEQNTVESTKKNHSNELINKGFLDYTDSLFLDSLTNEIRNSFNIYHNENFKILHIDAEELAEFNFEFFMPNLNKILAKRNIQLHVQKLNQNDNSYEILINDKKIQLYNQNHLNNYQFWDIAPRVFFKHLNLILKNEKCKEQFYLLYFGNDLHAILLTEEQFLIIEDYYKDNEDEKPYRP